MKHPLSSAITAIETAYNCGFDALRTFGLTRERPDILLNSFDPRDETYDEFIDRISDACWMGQEYFKMWLGDENKTLDTYRLDDLNLNNLSNGVYYMEFAGSESHYWVYIIDDYDIWYAGTYGGVCALTVKKFNKKQYSNRFIRAMKGSLEDYAYIFQVDPEIYGVNYEYIKYSKSDKY
jgi:hypothetical protein